MSEDKDRIIYELWKLLDNIDTFSDMYKDNYEGLSKAVYREQQKRWKIIENVDDLYDKYHPKDEEE